MTKIPDLRPSPIAGTWYEGNPQRLIRAVDNYLDLAELPELDGDIVAVIAPHAGHRFSGPVAGYAFAAVRGQTPDLVAVISPMHQYFNRPLITTAHSAYSTPLGNVTVDFDAIDALEANLNKRLGYGLAQVTYDHEHSLEIELPFLQRVLESEFKLLPVMVRSVEPEVSHALGLSLAEILRGKNALLVASTDLSHFYDQKIATTLDGEMLKQIEAFLPEALYETEASGKGFACGLGALTAVLWAAKELGANMVKVLRHATSGDVTGDYTQVVGYGAAVVLRTGSAQ
jgi:AmmeMemoRadiSam system protein B